MGQKERNATLTFETLKFYDEGEFIKILFLRNYLLKIPRESLNKIGKVSLDQRQQNSITFQGIDQQRAQKRFMFLLTNAFNNLQNIFTKKPAIYIHKNSGIPLLGTRFFGIHDRGTTLLEVKPITGCNAGCTFCSVDEGMGSKKFHDFVVEREYLIEETKKLLQFKKKEGMHIYINVHGEPLLYYDIVNLVKDLKAILYIKDITIISNGMLLTEQLIQDLDAAGLTTLNISVSAIDNLLAKQLMGTEAYNINKIKSILKYASTHAKFKTIITPVYVNGQNEQEMEKLIMLSKEIGCDIKIQKFCYNKAGRNPVKELPWESFYPWLETLEKKHGIKLKEEVYTLETTKEYPCPFKKGEVITAEIKCLGRYPQERVAVAKERCIVIPSCLKDSGNVTVRITGIQHNIITGEIL